ncbi:MAG TPA: DUF4232 domain-containing protein [Clostridia bacterium]|nr:DUF4232 domain-containing protein [Clostridia bacterium]
MTFARRTLLALGGLLLAACTNQAPTPTPPPSGAPSPPTATGAACAAADLSASAGGWSAAAGSRGADILVENAGSSACVLAAAPSVAIVDDAASVVLEGDPGESGTGAGPTLEPGGTVTFTVLASNWCDEPAGLPYHLVLRADGGAVQVTGLDLATADDLPPCNGPGQPATLSANAWVLP